LGGRAVVEIAQHPFPVVGHGSNRRRRYRRSCS
jgi:hypothetical protein